MAVFLACQKRIIAVLVSLSSGSGPISWIQAGAVIKMASILPMCACSPYGPRFNSRITRTSDTPHNSNSGLEFWRWRKRLEEICLIYCHYYWVCVCVYCLLIMWELPGDLKIWFCIHIIFLLNSISNSLMNTCA